MNILLSLFAFALVIAAPSALFAEVTSKPCPYSCKTQGLSHDSCKDWREGGTCFVEDLRSKAAAPSDLERKIVLVNKTILAGQNIKLSLLNNNPADHFDIVVRRSGGSSDTQLSVSLGYAIRFGTKQVDMNENHVIQFSANGTRAEGRRLLLGATSGDVFVESVHIMTR